MFYLYTHTCTQHNRGFLCALCVYGECGQPSSSSYQARAEVTTRCGRASMMLTRRWLPANSSQSISRNLNSSNSSSNRTRRAMGFPIWWGVFAGMFVMMGLRFNLFAGETGLCWATVCLPSNYNAGHFSRCCWWWCSKKETGLPWWDKWVWTSLATASNYAKCEESLRLLANEEFFLFRGVLKERKRCP